MSGDGWICPANQYRCLYPYPLAPGETAPTLYADFVVSDSASGAITYSAKVANGSDTNPGNDEASGNGPVQTRCPNIVFGGPVIGLGGDGGDFKTSLLAFSECRWVAVSNADWIKIYSGAGVSSGSISFSVAPNPHDEERMGSISAGGYSQQILQGARIANPVTNVSSATFRKEALAADSLVTAFGKGLATKVGTATTTPLPINIAGTSVGVWDPNYGERDAALLYVSPTQINFLIPGATRPGPAGVTVRIDSKIVASGTIFIEPVAPGLFTANASGQGVPAAVALRIKSNGAQQYEAVAIFDQAQNKFIALPLDLGPNGPNADQVYLVLFGTGVRGRSGLDKVNATIGGTAAAVLFAGPQGNLVGLDQINVAIPRSLAGRGAVDVVLTVDGKTSNIVLVNIK
jgi:uncharacterized protein (TIGR03437 family)